MEAMTVTWSTTTDELRLIVELIRNEIEMLERRQHMPSVIMMNEIEAIRYDMLVAMYNQLIIVI